MFEKERMFRLRLSQGLCCPAAFGLAFLAPVMLGGLGSVLKADKGSYVNEGSKLGILQEYGVGSE